MSSPTVPVEIRPQSGPQTAFLTSPADIVVYGGAAGGGKSWGILFECLRHINTPGFGAVVFRRLSTQIKNQGGLWDEAGIIYPQVGGVQKIGELEYEFPGTRNKIQFRHLQHEATKYNWQGGQIPLICFDELTHFTESQFFYMLSRNRSMCGVKPYVRATTNPDAGSWVKAFIGPWVDRKHPLYPTASGEILFMLRVKGKVQYFRTREEAVRAVPNGRPKTVTFIKASIHDNKKLLEADPEYLANLQAQTDVERRRLLEGDWDVVNEGLVYPAFGSCVVEDEDWPDLEKLPLQQVGGIDWGWRDALAALRAREDVNGTLWVDWSHYESRKTLTKFSIELTELESADKAHKPRWWTDPAGPTQNSELRLAGHDCIACVHLGSQPIKAGITVVTERIEQGTIRFHGSLGDLIDEASKYRYEESGKGRSEVPIDKDNHLMDALRYMVVGHDRGQVVKDEEPGETEAEAIAREEAEAQAIAEAEAEFRNPNTDHWWN